MTKVIASITMSLDGFIAGPHDHGKQLQDWLFSENTLSAYNSFFKLSEESTKVFDKFIETTGAIVAGRHTYDITGGRGGSHPFPGVPVYVLSSHVPNEIPQGSTPFTFVTDRIESAIGQARKSAGKKNVYVLGGASIAQHCLNAGLFDEMTIYLVPVLIGDGVRL